MYFLRRMERDAAIDDCGVCLQGICEVGTHFCSHGEGHMDDLMQLRIIKRAGWIVFQQFDELCRTPCCYLTGGGERGGRDSKHRSVGFDEVGGVGEGSDKDFLGKIEAFAARFSEASDLLEPSCAGGF